MVTTRMIYDYNRGFPTGDDGVKMVPYVTASMVVDMDGTYP